MEEKQMRKHTFFSKIGAFSIDLSNPRSIVRSMRYALSSLEREKACLFIYPEGKITPVSDSTPEFKNGLSWLYKNTADIDFVPIGIYSHSFRSAKPELYILIGDSVDHDKSLNSITLNINLENDLGQILKQIRESAGSSDKGFKPQY